MRVGVIGKLDPDSFAENVSGALRDMGHAVTQLGPARPHRRSRSATHAGMLARQAWPGLDEHFQRRISQNAIDAGCEVVINLDASLMPSVVSRLSGRGVRVAFWFPDHVANLGRQLMLLAPYDAIFFKEPHLVERLRAILDLPVYYLPEACNPQWHRPLVRPGTEPYLVVPANMYPYRVRLLERLLAKGIPLKVYGAGFPRWLGATPVRKAHTGRCVFREDKARVYRSAAGVLSTMHPAEMAGVNGRLFQATGCGAAVLTEYRRALPELYDIGHEVLAFHDFDELVGQATRLLNETGLTGSLGDAAARRAHRDHTYDQRVATILEKVS
jgi:spore maturation protein CgeB